MKNEIKFYRILLENRESMENQWIINGKIKKKTKKI